MLSVVAGISLAYDLAAGLVLLVATESMATWFGAPVPNPILFAKLNGLFLIAVGLGYLGPIFRPDVHRLYMWIFGLVLKGGGALLFVWNYFTHGSPESFLLFAIADGALASWTLVALLKKDASAP